MRNSTKEAEDESQKRLAIPITVRQLEAIIRISESLAKMQLQPFAVERHVDEALRLFQVSTLDAAMTGSLSGAEGFTTQEDQGWIYQSILAHFNSDLVGFHKILSNLQLIYS